MVALRYLNIGGQGRILLPLLFILSVAVFSLVLPYSSSSALYGYDSGLIDEFDGYICGNYTAGSSSPITACNGYMYGNYTSNGNRAFNGYTGNYPYLYWPAGGLPKTGSPSGSPRWGGYHYTVFGAAKNGSNLVSPGYNYMGMTRLRAENEFQIPESWYGHKVFVTFDLDMVYSLKTESNFKPVGNDGIVELNWGAVHVVPAFSDVTKCLVADNIPTAYVQSPVTTSTWIVFGFDFTNVTSDDCEYWNYYLTSTDLPLSEQGNGWKYLLANFSEDNFVAWNYPLIAYDVISDEDAGSIEEIVDDWKTQQEQEFIYQSDYINSHGSSAQSQGSTISSVFSFAVTDPLLGIFSLFTDNQCVNIPIIGGMIHVTNTQVCSPWSSQVRGNLTPVFTIGGTLLLWGFVMNWLRNDGAMVEVSEYTKSFRSKQ